MQPYSASDPTEHIRMQVYGLRQLNGRVTGSKDLVMNKLVRAASSSNRWSSSENNQTNAWNINFSNGNFNNNNKYNSNVVRAVCELDEEILVGWVDAFFDCCRHKMTSHQCTLYRLFAEEDIPRLAYEAEYRVYKPTTSTCFVVTRPKLREVFAAAFRDRIVQHWICMRIEPLFEERFEEQGNVSFNCRKGYGTTKAVEKLAADMKRVSKHYTQESWIGKFDIRSFFMSIDCQTLEDLLIPFIREKYHENDIETLIYLTQETIRHEPQHDCQRKGDLTLWDKLEHHKSLFYAPPLVGMPIGNLTSQLFANFYMSFFDEYMNEECEKRGCYYTRFVDDFAITGPNKQDIIDLYHLAALFLKEKLHLHLHEDKFYLQEVRKGVKFVGSVIKKYRIYLSNRTVGSMYNAIFVLDKICKRIYEADEPTLLDLCDLECAVSGMNSYFGFLVHCNSYAIRRAAFKDSKFFWKICYLEGHCHVVKIKYNYKLSTRLVEDYGFDV